MSVKSDSKARLQPSPEDDEAPQPLYAAPALEKGLDILELLSRQESGLTRRDIAEQLGRSVSEVFRMIEVLTRRSYLVQTGDTYVLGMRLFELAHEFPPMNRLLKEALPRMEALAKTVDQSCHLTVLSGPRQMVVAQVDPPAGMGFSMKIGAMLPLLKSASGRVLLTFQDEEEMERLMHLADPNATEAERTVMWRTIAKVGAQGFAFMPSNQFSGMIAISYPILDLRGRAIAALTVPYVKRLDNPSSVSAEGAQVMLAEAAADLTAALGGAVAKAHEPAKSRRSGSSPAKPDRPLKATRQRI
ncbi:MAG: IclR family transcriptional regulator [Azospirillum brasilense]|nr:MAG: IclR family transcriptional regulator [Azospirillum brasilense]